MMQIAFRIALPSVALSVAKPLSTMLKPDVFRSLVDKPCFACHPCQRRLGAAPEPAAANAPGISKNIRKKRELNIGHLVLSVSG
jgi:hypothetical protein